MERRLLPDLFTMPTCGHLRFFLHYVFFFNIFFPPSQWRESQKELSGQPNTSMLAGQCMAKKPGHTVFEINQTKEVQYMNKQNFDETLVRHL